MATTAKQRVTLFIDADLLKQAKAQAVIDDITLTTLVETSLIKHLPPITIIKKPNIGSEVDGKANIIKREVY